MVKELGLVVLLSTLLTTAAMREPKLPKNIQQPNTNTFVITEDWTAKLVPEIKPELTPDLIPLPEPAPAVKQVAVRRPLIQLFVPPAMRKVSCSPAGCVYEPEGVDWRLVQFNGKWWFWCDDNQWLIYNGTEWEEKIVEPAKVEVKKAEAVQQQPQVIYGPASSCSGTTYQNPYRRRWFNR